MYCVKCGTKLNDTDNFCPECGTKVSVRNSQVQEIEPEIPTNKPETTDNASSENPFASEVNPSSADLERELELFKKNHPTAAKFMDKLGPTEEEFLHQAKYQ